MADDVTIRPGQVYESCQPTFVVDGKETHTRICVLSAPVGTPGLYGFGKVAVATLGENHRPLRPRQLEASQLHASGTTKTGQPRRTGYRLVTEPKEETDV